MELHTHIVRTKEHLQIDLCFIKLLLLLLFYQWWARTPKRGRPRQRERESESNVHATSIAWIMNRCYAVARNAIRPNKAYKNLCSSFINALNNWFVVVKNFTAMSMCHIFIKIIFVSLHSRNFLTANEKMIAGTIQVQYHCNPQIELNWNSVRQRRRPLAIPIFSQ